VVAVFLAAPSAMAKKTMNEAELDLITAAGQPTIVQSSGEDVAVSVLIDIADAQLEIGDTAQTNLTALVLNNVAGENQLGNALNVMGAPGSGVSANQTNEITQSWGSVKDIGVTTVPAGEGGDTGDVNGKCVFADCSTASTGGNGAILNQTAHADHILDAVSEDGVAVAVDFQAPVFDLILGGTAQESLVALVVNNVVGRNQVANGINVAGGNIGFAGGLSVVGAGGAIAATQSNTITQYRGTPLTRPSNPATPIAP
jgi:hypothetical protein